MECELCGRKTANLIKTKIFGTTMMLCDSCAKMGKPEPSHKIKTKKPKIQRIQPEEVVVDNFAELLKAARENIGLDQKAFAQKLGIKQAELSAYESGRRTPEIKVAKKFEKILNIKLVETV